MGWIRAASVLSVVLLCGTGGPVRAEVLICSPQDARPPVAFGVDRLVEVLQEAGERVNRLGRSGPPQGPSILVTLACDAGALEAFGVASADVGEQPESFAVIPVAGRRDPAVAVIGRDAAGAMYGALELAERVTLAEDRFDLGAIRATRQTPFTGLRGVNLFLHVQALDDPESWYFDDDFWRGFIDRLAATRHNFLDIHATYDLQTTEFPNVYPCFFRLPGYPDVGVPEDRARRNLDRFRKIVALAAERGIRVGLMSYSARWNLAGQEFRDPGDRALADYTAGCVELLMGAVPDLYVIGFRIGETGRDPSFFQDSYIRGLKLAGRTGLPLYTRSWVTSHPGIEAIAAGYPGRVFNEIKFNGEQLGLPYQVTGGWMASQGSYAYQWYSDFPSPLETIWQIRANGTHRVFPWGDPGFVARTVRACTFMNAAGFTVEPLSAYYSWTDVWSRGADAWWRWTWQRDWFWYVLWGRLGYDPDIPERTWVRMFERRFGTAAGRAVYEMFTASSRLVPLIYHYRNGGPDHRSIAPECQTGGTLEQFLRPVPPSHMKATPLDVSCYLSIAEYVDLLATGETTGRIQPPEVARTLEEEGRRSLEAADRARTAGVRPEAAAEFETMVDHARAIRELAGYYAHKILAAVELGLHERTGEPEALERLQKHVDAYLAAWERLVEITDRTFRPFPEPLACKTQAFHWRTEGRQLAEDLRMVREYVARARGKPAAPTPSSSSRPSAPAGCRDDGTGPVIEPLPPAVDRQAGQATLTARITDPGGVARVLLRWKPTPSVYSWTEVRPDLDADGLYSARVPLTYEGLQYLYEAVDVCGHGTLAPDPRCQRPWILVPGWERPADEVYFGPRTLSFEGITVTCNHRFRFDRLVRETTTFWDREHTIDRYPAELEGLPRIRYTVDELQFAPAWFIFQRQAGLRIYAAVEGPVPPGWRQAKSMSIQVRRHEQPVWYLDIPAGRTELTTVKGTRLMFVALAPRTEPPGR